MLWSEGARREDNQPVADEIASQNNECMTYCLQMFVLGSYPVHYHMALDVDSNGTAAGPFVRSNTIRDTFSRCVTIHGTSGVRVEDNVAVDHFGHCYFLGGLRADERHFTPQVNYLDLHMLLECPTNEPLTVSGRAQAISRAP